MGVGVLIDADDPEFRKRSPVIEHDGSDRPKGYDKSPDYSGHPLTWRTIITGIVVLVGWFWLSFT